MPRQANGSTENVGIVKENDVIVVKIVSSFDFGFLLLFRKDIEFPY